MSLESITAVIIGLSQSTKKRESPIEPFRRTLDLANSEYEKARVELMTATETLAGIALEQKRDSNAKS